MLAIKELSHVFQFFISTQWQKRGIGKRLWKHYLQVNESGDLSKEASKFITVNSSDFGKSFYLKLGFNITESRQLKNGVYYTPMEFSL